jgi:hypothetical protein
MKTLKDLLKIGVIIYLICQLAILYREQYKKEPNMLEMPKINYDPTITDRKGFILPQPLPPDPEGKKTKKLKYITTEK